MRALAIPDDLAGTLALHPSRQPHPRFVLAQSCDSPLPRNTFLTPFHATLTNSALFRAKCAFLSPFLATLTNPSSGNSFICHFYEKHRGGGGSQTISHQIITLRTLFVTRCQSSWNILPSFVRARVSSSWVTAVAGALIGCGKTPQNCHLKVRRSLLWPKDLIHT